MQPQDVIPFFEKSRKALGLDYLDLFLIHAPMGCKRDEKKDTFKFYDGKVFFWKLLWSHQQIVNVINRSNLIPTLTTLPCGERWRSCKSLGSAVQLECPTSAVINWRDWPTLQRCPSLWTRLSAMHTSSRRSFVRPWTSSKLEQWPMALLDHLVWNIKLYCNPRKNYPICLILSQEGSTAQVAYHHHPFSRMR